MLYSADRNFVFVAVPKTGTTAIHRCLRSADPSIFRNQVHNASGQLVSLPTHATAWQIRKTMGTRAQNVTFVAFVRDPYDVMVSKYHFYRSGRAARKQGLATHSPGEKRRFDVGKSLRVLFAQLLPLSLWAPLYPCKSSFSFVADPNGKLLVDRVGRMEHLQKDVLRIFLPFGYTKQQLQLGIANHTEYEHAIPRDPKLEAIVARRLPEDIAMIEKLRAERS